MRRSGVAMHPCPRCRALVIVGAACPVCTRPGAPAARTLAIAAITLGLVGTGTACVTAMYGLPATDDDGDGYSVPVDCDDDDPDVHPNAVEVPGNDVDDDCDGDIDEADA